MSGWFKHMANASSDPMLVEAQQKFGDAGYAAFFRILELLTEHFNPKTPGIWHGTFKQVRKKLHKSSTKVQLFLNFYAEKSKFRVEYDGDYITILCPKYKELMSEYAHKRLRKMSGHISGQMSGIDKRRVLFF